MTANAFNDAYEKIFGKVEENLKAFTVSEKLSGKEAHNALKRTGGKTYQYTSYDEGTTQEVTQYSDMTIDINTAQPTLMDLNIQESYTFKIDDFDRFKYGGHEEFLASKAKNAVKQLTRTHDSNFLAAYSDANNHFDDEDIGGSADTPITLAAANVVKVFSEANAKVQDLTGDSMENFVVITPKQLAIMAQANVSQGFNVADKTLRNGFLGDFLGLATHLSSYLSHEVVGTAAANFIADEVVTVGGIAFTFKAAPAVANEVDVGADAETSLENLAAAITQGTGAGTKYIAATAANARILRQFTVSSDATTITIVGKWGLFLAVETGAQFSFGTTIVHNIMGQKGCIEKACPIGIKNKIGEEPRQTTVNYLSFTQMGIKTPRISKDKFLDLRIAA